MLNVVVWRWGTKYSSAQVNTLWQMLSRNLHIEWQLFCITDDATGLRKEICSRIWPSYGFGRARRLQLYDPVLAERDIGKRILQIDLDCVITGDITPLVNREDPLVIWESVHATRWLTSTSAAGVSSGVLSENKKPAANPFNASLILMNSGVFPTLWSDYCKDPAEIEKRARKAGHWTALVTNGQGIMLAPGDDDQAVMTLYAKPLRPPTWGEQDGVYKYRRLENELPKNARIVFFQGRSIDKYIPQSPWIAEHLH